MHRLASEEIYPWFLILTKQVEMRRLVRLTGLRIGTPDAADPNHLVGLLFVGQNLAPQAQQHFLLRIGPGFNGG